MPLQLAHKNMQKDTNNNADSTKDQSIQYFKRQAGKYTNNKMQQTS